MSEFPVKTIKRKQKSRKPWVDRELYKMIQKKNKTYY